MTMTRDEFKALSAFDRETVAFSLLDTVGVRFEDVTGEPEWMDRVGPAWQRARRKVLRWAERQLKPEV